MIACDYPGCTAQYRRKEHLTRHARKHLPSEHQLSCEYCEKSFDRTDTLRRHRQLHLREHEDEPPRTPKACDHCHSRKSRCDGKEPCTGCSRRRRVCTYSRQSKRLSTVTRDTAAGSETMQDLLLQHECNLREAGILVPPEPGGTTGAEISGAETGGESQFDIDLDQYGEVYFAHFHYQWPILHKPSSKPGQGPHILLLTIAMIGLWITGDRRARAKAENMNEKLLTLLESRMGDWTSHTEFKDKAWPMTTYQVLVLNIIFAMIREVHLDCCSSMLHALTTICLTGGLFSYDTMLAQTTSTDSVIFTWSYIEEMKRLALAIFKLNIFFKTRLLTVEDLRFPLPEDGYLWDAQGSKEWYHRYNVQLKSGTYQTRFISDIFADVRAGKGGMGLLLQADSWLGFLLGRV